MGCSLGVVMALKTGTAARKAHVVRLNGQVNVWPPNGAKNSASVAVIRVEKIAATTAKAPRGAARPAETAPRSRQAKSKKKE